MVTLSRIRREFAFFFSERYLLITNMDLTTSANRAGRAFFIPWSIVGIGNMTLLFSVLSEGWSSRYKSNLQAGRVRRLVRQRMLFLKQAPKKTAISEKSDALARLLDSEGFKSVAEEPVPPAELPKKVADTVRGFHAHARYFMLGRTGDPPPQLQTLLDAVDDLDTKLDPIFAAKASALTESTAGRDTKQYLFMLAYEREFDRVIASASQLSSVIENVDKELVSLKEENDRLQAELRQLRPAASAANDSPPTDNETGSTDSPRSLWVPRTPTLSFVTPSGGGESRRPEDSLSIPRTNTFPQSNICPHSSSLNPPSSLGVRGGVAARKQL